MRRRLLGKNLSLFRECNLQRLQSKHEELTEEEVMTQQQRMAIMKDPIKKIRSKRKDGCQEPMVGLGVAGEGL